jgi:hypothetical protein
MNMQKISLFQNWLVETEGLDAERLAELDLLSGPFVQWRLEIKQPTYLESNNPPIGQLSIYSDWRERGGLRGRYTYTLYPSSFAESSDECMERLRDYYYSRMSIDEFRAWIRAHLAIAVDKYAPNWIDLSVPILCREGHSGKLGWLDPL